MAKNKGIVKFQIIQYASICEALLNYTLETYFKEEFESRYENETEIIPEEAEIIRKIFADYLAGKGIQSIADDLNRLNIPLRSTSKTQHWRCSTIEYILSNERYIGDSLWQKTYQTQTLPRKPKKNKGEKIQYFLEQTHPAIIDRETFQKAQRLRASRVISKNSSADPIRQKLVCGVCGSPYRIISNQGMDSYECQAKNRGTAKCETPRLSKTQIHKAFLSLYYRIKTAIRLQNGIR